MTTSTSSTSPDPRKRLLGNTQFCWLLAGNTTLFLGFSATILLRSLLAWQLTEDEMSLAYINLIAASCMFVTSIFSGAVIDRFERRKLMFFGELVIIIAESSILILLATGHLTFGILMLSALASSVVFPFVMPARTAMLVDIVGRPTLGKANAIMAGGINVARMVSPAIAGILSDLAGMVYAYIFLITLHLCSLMCIYCLKPNYPQLNPGKGDFLGEIKEGFVYIYRHRPILLCVVFGLLPILVVVPLQNLMVVFVDNVWNQGGSGLGIMMAAMGVGGLLGSLVTALLKSGNYVKPMMISAGVLGIFLILFSNASNFWLAVGLLMFVYGSSVVAQTLVNTSVQLMVDDHVRGRISTVTLMSYGLAPLGTIPLAFAAKNIGAPQAMTIAAVIMMLGVLCMWFFAPSFRRIDEASKIY